MKKKSGFTLMELMAVIVLLSVLSVIGVSVYRTVDEKTKIQAYNNKVSYIETKAANFASDTGYLSTNVNYLVELGYIEADTKAGEVLSPIDKEKMNDYVVTITKTGDNYYAKLTTKKEENLDNIDMVNANVEIIAYEVQEDGTSGEKVNESWTNKNVNLVAEFKSTAVVDKSQINKVIWHTNVQDIESPNNSLEYLVEAEQIISTSYRVEIMMNDGTKYEARRTVRIDKQRPIVYLKEITIENENAYTNANKKVRIMSSDQSGSGIKGYYVGTERNCTSVSYTENASEIYEVEKGNGKYYVCVKDQAGNVSEDESSKDFDISHIDTAAPSCEVKTKETPGKNNWYTGDIHFYVAATDDDSGIRNTEISADKLTMDTASFVVKGKARDKAGNEATCSLEVKRDATKPGCDWNDAPFKNKWTASNRTVTVKGTDEMSGTSSIQNFSYTSGTTSTAALSYTVEDNAGNTKLCSKTANVYVDKTAPTKPTSGAIGGVSGSNAAASIKTGAGGSTDTGGSGVKEYRYRVTNTNTAPAKTSFTSTSKSYTRSCGTSYYAWAVAVDNVGNVSDVTALGSTSDKANSYSAWGSCSKKCGRGTQTRTNTCLLITSGLSQSCNTQGCCDLVDYTDGTSCSKKCGGGTTNRLAYSHYDGSRCSQKDLSSGGKACNTQDCCSSKSSSSSCGDWSSCNASCGGGTQWRSCTTSYTSNYDGSSCGSTPYNDYRSCNTHSCPPTLPTVLHPCREGNTWGHDGPSTSSSQRGPWSRNCSATIKGEVNGFYLTTVTCPTGGVWDNIYFKKSCLSNGSVCSSTVCPG